MKSGNELKARYMFIIVIQIKVQILRIKSLIKKNLGDIKYKEIKGQIWDIFYIENSGIFELWI